MIARFKRKEETSQRFVLKYKFPLGELGKYKTKGEENESSWLTEATERNN